MTCSYMSWWNKNDPPQNDLGKQSYEFIYKPYKTNSGTGKQILDIFATITVHYVKRDNMFYSSLIKGG